MFMSSCWSNLSACATACFLSNTRVLFTLRKKSDDDDDRRENMRTKWELFQAQTAQCSTGATSYVTVVTCHYHFFKVEFTIFQAILSLNTNFTL